MKLYLCFLPNPFFTIRLPDFGGRKRENCGARPLNFGRRARLNSIEFSPVIYSRTAAFWIGGRGAFIPPRDATDVAKEWNFLIRDTRMTYNEKSIFFFVLKGMWKVNVEAA